MKRRFAALVLLMILVLALAVPAMASREIVQPTAAGYVADYADVLSSDTEQSIIKKVKALDAACGGQIVVVTIDYLNDLNAEEYAYEVLNQWGVGDKTKNNGAVLLLVTGEGKGWLTVGTGLEDYISAGVANEILDTDCWPDFDAGDYDAAATKTVDALLARYESYYGITIDDTSVQPQGQTTETPQQSAHSQRFGDIIWLIVVLVLLNLVFGGVGRRRMNLFFCGPGLCGPGPRPPHGGGFHGGGFGGGSFGGGSFGGGFGGFGGGGGRGGGAGRR